MIWANVIKTDKLCSNRNLRLSLFSEAKFIAGIKIKPAGMVVIAIKKINKKASKFLNTKIDEATMATLNT